MSHESSRDKLTDADIRGILTRTMRVAVVGASDKLARPSYGVMAALLAHGYTIIPVNPGLAGQRILEQTVVGSLAEAGELDMVDVFRASDQVSRVVDEAIRLGARTVWLQLGVIDEAAAERARAAGLDVVVDRCPKIEFVRLGIGPLNDGGKAATSLASTARRLDP